MHTSLDRVGLHGWLTWQLHDAGRIIATGTATNLVTQAGDQMYAERGAGIAGPPSPPTGMRLGTGSTTPAKTGAGAALGSYVTGSQLALDAGYPTTALAGASRRLTYRCSWPSGTATATGIYEIVLTNETPLTNAAGSSANTIARALLRVAVNKGAGQSLVINWQHDLLGG